MHAVRFGRGGSGYAGIRGGVEIGQPAHRGAVRFLTHQSVISGSHFSKWTAGLANQDAFGFDEKFCVKKKSKRPSGKSLGFRVWGFRFYLSRS